MKTLNTREELLALVPKNARMTEIGVFKGEFSEMILRVCQPTELFLVDMWKGRISSGDKDGKNIIHVNMDDVFENIIVPKFTDTPAIIVKDSSDSYFEKTPADHLDAIYIDAAHNYRAVKKDLENARKVVKPGGIIMGHDYNEETLS